MPINPIAFLSTLGGGSFAFRITPSRVVRVNRGLAFGLLGLTAYTLCLIATLPARAVLPSDGRDIDGSIWRGEAAVGAFHAVSWRWAPLTSIVNLAYAADLRVSGPGTDLQADASWRFGHVMFENMNGRASGSLLAGLVPSLPFQCEMTIEVAIERALLGSGLQGAAGELRSDVGSCRRVAGPSNPVTVPALIAVSTLDENGSRAWLAPQGRHDERLVELALDPDGGAALTVLPTAATLFPGITATQSVPIGRRR